MNWFLVFQKSWILWKYFFFYSIGEEIHWIFLVKSNYPLTMANRDPIFPNIQFQHQKQQPALAVKSFWRWQELLAYQTLKILTRAIRVLMDCQGSSFTSPYPSQLSFQMQVAVTMEIVHFTLLKCSNCCLKISTIKSSNIGC